VSSALYWKLPQEAVTMADDVLSLSRVDIDAAAARRASLHSSTSHLRSLLAPSEGSHHPFAHPLGRAALAGAVADVAHLWSRHIAATEAPEGLLAQIVTDAPRLAGTVERFRREHPLIGEQLAVVRQLLERIEAEAEAAEAHVEARALRERLLALLDGIDRHRRGGHELIYRAYCVDIGLGE
jgi:hypothetical protein